MPAAKNIKHVRYSNAASPRMSQRTLERAGQSKTQAIPTDGTANDLMAQRHRGARAQPRHKLSPGLVHIRPRNDPTCQWGLRFDRGLIADRKGLPRVMSRCSLARRSKLHACSKRGRLLIRELRLERITMLQRRGLEPPATSGRHPVRKRQSASLEIDPRSDGSRHRDARREIGSRAQACASRQEAVAFDVDVDLGKFVLQFSTPLMFSLPIVRGADP